MVLMLDFSIPKRIEIGQLFVALPFHSGYGDTRRVKLDKGFNVFDNVGGSVNLSHILYVDDSLIIFWDIDKEIIL